MQNNARYKIGKVHISATNPQDTAEQISKAVHESLNTYICVSNLRMVRLANANEEYREVMESAYMCLPDGMPLVWCAKLWGHKEVKNTNGPTLFMEMLRDKQCKITHFLLGDTEETLDVIEQNEEFNASIAGTYSPPFAEIDEFDYQGIAQRINDSGANIVWISMTAPKQDYFALKIQPFLHEKLCIGVGRAFRFATGEFRLPDKKLQKIGMTGVLCSRRSIWSAARWYIGSSLHLTLFLMDILWNRYIFKEKTQNEC